MECERRNWEERYYVACVGIIANPSSGKDIRRLVAHGSVLNNNEKVNIVRRVFLGLDAAGVDTVLTMPDAFNICDDGTAHALAKVCRAVPLLLSEKEE